MPEPKFTKDHEWIRLEDNGDVVIGITQHAQEQLGDVVFVELPDVGRKVAAKDDAAVVESVKAASEVYAPISGTVTAVNEALNDTPGLVNEAAESEGWFFKLTPENVSELDDLMDAAGYAAYLEGQD